MSFSPLTHPQFSSRICRPRADRTSKRNAILALYGVRDVDLIVDRFSMLADVTKAVRQAGLESCSLIFGIDYTLSNVQQGQRTFGGRSLHALEAHLLNPYQRVILTLGETLEEFDDDGLIPGFGFGDIQTKDKGVFPLKPGTGICKGFREVYESYNLVTPHVQLSGPTNFAPLIYKAIEIVRQARAVCTHLLLTYYLLLIIAHCLHEHLSWNNYLNHLSWNNYLNYIFDFEIQIQIPVCGTVR